MKQTSPDPTSACDAPDDDPADLIVNPSLRTDFSVRWQVRDHGPQQLEMAPGNDAHMGLAALARLAQGSDTSLRVRDLDIDFADGSLEALRSLGVFIERSAEPTGRPFSADYQRIWAQVLATQGELPARDALVVNPRVWAWHQEADRSRACWTDVYELCESQLDTCDHTLFIQHPETLVVTALQFPEDALVAWQRLARRDIDIGRLEEEHLRRFVAAGVVHPKGTSHHQRVRTSGHDLRDRQFAVLRDFLSPFQVEIMREYCWWLVDEGRLPRGDEHVDLRWFRWGDPVMKALHYSISPLIRRITAETFEPSRPSYSYLAVYARGADLFRHTDRPQCRWNLSVCFGSQPHLPLDEQWPIWLECDGQPHEVRLRPGDAVLYAGAQTPHWREPLTQAERYAFCFFHFVDLAWEGRID